MYEINITASHFHFLTIAVNKIYNAIVVESAFKCAIARSYPVIIPCWVVRINFSLRAKAVIQYKYGKVQVLCFRHPQNKSQRSARNLGGIYN